MPPLRLFTALLPPPVVRDELGALAGPLEGVRWTPPDNLHLTLRFLGDCDPDRQERFAEALTRVRVEPFILPVAGLGLFPSRGPAKVLWAGTGRAHTRLFQLRKQVDEALLSAEPGLDVHSFHPHFTLGRLGTVYDPKALAVYLARHAGFETPPFRVGEFHLMASDLQPGRAPAYRSIRVYPLAG
jgi:2'-5' RNA ligase